VHPGDDMVGQGNNGKCPVPNYAQDEWAVLGGRTRSGKSHK
jgi:hypothetical protein